MTTNEAMNILSLTGTVTQKEIKKAFKKASLKFHPDRNPAGQQMMILINAAFDHLKKFGGESVQMSDDFQADDFCEHFNEILNELLKMEGLTVEICGNWIWIGGETKKYSKKLGKDGLKCFYAIKKKMWYFRPAAYKSFNRKTSTISEIRAKYGSVTPLKTKQKQMAIN